MTHARLLTLSALTLGSLALGNGAAQTLVPFSNPKLPFSFSHPQGWYGINLDDRTNGVSMVSAKKAPATMIRLLFVPDSKKVNLPEQFSGFEAGIKSTGVQVQKQSSYAARYGGLSGMEREYVITKKGKNVKMRVWFAQDKKNVYCFQLTDTPERYAAASTLFTRMMGTVKFK